MTITKEEGIAMPPPQQKIVVEPRICADEEVFRDMIRRRYNCEAIGMNICMQKLSFIDTSRDDINQQLDLLRELWDYVRGAFENPAFHSHWLRVEFEALDDPMILSTRSLRRRPNRLGSSHRLKVMLRQTRINDKTSAAFGRPNPEEQGPTVKNGHNEVIPSATVEASLPKRKNRTREEPLMFIRRMESLAANRPSRAEKMEMQRT